MSYRRFDPLGFPIIPPARPNLIQLIDSEIEGRYREPKKFADSLLDNLMETLRDQELRPIDVPQMKVVIMNSARVPFFIDKAWETDQI